MKGLAQGLSLLWRDATWTDDGARGILTAFGQAEWLEFSAVNAAATLLGTRTDGFRMDGEGISVQAKEDRDSLTVSTASRSCLATLRTRDREVRYSDFPRTAFIAGRIATSGVPVRRASRVLMAMAFVLYHGDSILLHPSEIRNAEFARQGLRFGFPPTFLHSLLYCVPIAVPMG